MIRVEMFLYRSLSFLTIYIWRSILKYNTTFLYWCKNIDSYYWDEILNPPDPTRGDFKPARPDPWRFQTRPTRPDFLKMGPNPTLPARVPDPTGRVGSGCRTLMDHHYPMKHLNKPIMFIFVHIKLLNININFIAFLTHSFSFYCI